MYTKVLLDCPWLRGLSSFRVSFVKGVDARYWCHMQDKVAKVTVITRRKVNSVAESYGVDVKEEEEQGRLVQHVEGEH